MLATIRLIALAQRDALATPHDPDPDTHRQLVIVEVTDGAGRSGYGECSALNAPGYAPEWAAGAYEILTTEPRRVAATTHPMAAAAVEMARLDLDLRRQGRSLADQLTPGTSRRVKAGAVVALGSTADTIAACARLADDGFERLKVKISPDDQADRVLAVRRALPRIELQLDANGSFTGSDLDRVMAYTDHDIRAIEQPFAPHDERSAGALVARLDSEGIDTLVVADEAATDLSRIRTLLRRRAATAISIKPPRVGGLERALHIHDWCRADDVPVTAGGMLECGLGRHALAALGLLQGFTLTGDLSPARRWLAEDPWPDLAMADGTIRLPDVPGVAPLPDLDLLETRTRRVATVDLG